jgi:ABC-type transport system substrate-binding protein
MNKKLMYISLSVIALFILSSVAVSQSTMTRDPNFKSLSTQAKPDAWILDLQDHFDDPLWFYDNLNATERKIIRQALDFAVPRNEIITSILSGHGLLLATTVIPQTGAYYDASVVPRAYSSSTALSMLASVFGYSYSITQVDNAATPYDETLAYFPMEFSVPNTNPLRAQWASRIATTYSDIGVDVGFNLYDFPTITARVFDADGYRTTHLRGGFDMQFIGWGGSVIPGDHFFFHTESFAPAGGNYQGYNSSTMDAIIDEYDITKNTSRRVELYHDFQAEFYDEAIRNILYQSVDIYGLDSTMTGFNPSFGSSQQWQNITIGAQTTLVASRPGAFSHHNPYISNSWYDNYILGTTYYGLVTSIINASNIWTTYGFFADFAGSDVKVVTDSEELFWNFTLKSGLLFNDGSPMNASDVEFSYLSMLNGEFPASSGYRSQLSNTSSIIVYDATHIGFNLTEWSPFSDISLFGLPILSKAQMGQITNLTSWSTHHTNTNTTLVSNGPYAFHSISGNTAYLVFNSTVWTPAYTDKFDNVPYMYELDQNSGVPDITNVTIVLNNDATAALTALKNGEIDLIDSNSGLSSVYAQITGTAKVATYTGASWQEAGLNQAHPIWGHNPIKPDPVVTTTTTSSAAVTTTGPESSGPVSPFGDLATISVAFIFIGVVSYSIRKRKN